MTIRWRGRHYFDNLAVGTLEGYGVQEKGTTYYVDTVNGSNSNSGLNWDVPLATVAAAFAKVDDNGIIAILGDVREQITAPLGVTGVRVIGAAGGRTRHDDGVRWREPVTALDAPLVTIRQQGWEFHNILFVPQDGYSAIRARREENATYPDGGHFKVKGCKFIGGGGIGTPQGYGIEDYGGCHHYLIEECEFNDLAKAIACTNHSIAAPLRDIIRKNIFEGNTSDIEMNASLCMVLDNLFRTPYAVSHPTTVNLALTADPATGNSVIGNFFADATANVTIAKGYKPSTGDVWRNFVTDAADPVVAVPS